MDDIVAKMRRSPANIKFSELEKVCDHHFESRNSTKTSHRTYKTPWPGATITATIDGTVERVALGQATKVEGGDLIVAIR